MCVLSSCRPTSWVKRSVATFAIKLGDKKRRKSKTVTLFPKWNIDMTIQLQVLSIHKSIINVTMRLVKCIHQLVALNKSPKTQVDSFTHPRKTRDLFQSAPTGVWGLPTLCFKKVLKLRVAGRRPAQAQEMTAGWRRFSRFCLESQKSFAKLLNSSVLVEKYIIELFSCTQSRL